MQIPFPWLSPCRWGIYNFTLSIPAEGEQEAAAGRALRVSRTLPGQRQGWDRFVASAVCGGAGPAALAPAGRVHAGQGTAAPASPGGSGTDAAAATFPLLHQEMGFVRLERAALHPNADFWGEVKHSELPKIRARKWIPRW